MRRLEGRAVVFPLRLLLPLLLFLLALLPACGKGPSPPVEDASIRVEVPASLEVEFGKAFPLAVVRTWRKDLAPEPWDDRLLSPLVLRLVEITARDDGERVEERRLFDAYAFSRGGVSVPAPRFRASSRRGGPEREASAPPIALRVVSALDPESAGAAELPGDPLPPPRPPFPWARWAAAAAAALAVFAGAAALLARRRRRRRRAAEPQSEPFPPEPDPPHVRALERLDRLKTMDPRTDAENEAFHVEAAAILRDYVAERFTVRANEMTTEETLRSFHLLEPRRGSDLSDALRRCDLVKFAAHAPDASDRGRVIEAAGSFIGGTRSNGAPDEVAR